MAVFSLASRAGFNVSGLIATSAVLTAVIGLALKDTLGNVIGGLSLQTDRSIHLGDWIKVGDVEGRVVDIRWRYTAVETRNGETLIVPNGVLTTEKVMVLGRRQGAPLQWRRWVHFNVDLRQSPPEVVRVVTEAIVHAPIPARGRGARARLSLPRRAAELRPLRRALLAHRPRARPRHRQRGARRASTSRSSAPASRWRCRSTRCC